MRTYSKPSASVELFCLDSEFAGGCNKIEKPFSVEESFVETGAQDLLTEFALIEAGSITADQAMNIQQVIAFNTEFESYNGTNKPLKPYLENGGNMTVLMAAWENATVIQENGGAITDNLTSGYCYFTFTAPLNKTFS